MKVTLWYVVIDCGDGGNYAAFFPTKKDAETRLQHEIDTYGYGAEGIDSVTLEVDGDKVTTKWDYISQDKDYNEIYPEKQ